MDTVQIDRDILRDLMKWAGSHKPVDFAESLSMHVAKVYCDTALSRPSVAPAGLLVSRPLLATFAKCGADHRDRCDIGRADHAELSAALIITGNILRAAS